MSKQAITTINGVEIFAVMLDGEPHVPIKPMCEAIGVNYTSQLEKLQKDPTFAGATVPLRGIVAADGKAREMACLPLWLTYLWLGTINPVNVKDESRESVLNYRLECARVLYSHFTQAAKLRQEQDATEIALLKQIASANESEKEAKAARKDAERKLEHLRAERLNPQPSLF